MSAAGSLPWLARHEWRLAWRDWLGMMTRKRKTFRGRVIGLAIFILFMHVIGYFMARHFLAGRQHFDKSTYILLTGSAFLSWSLMLSQAMETVTRAFYTRSDLDLILASPVSARRVFSVRIAAIAGSTTLTALLVTTPFIDGLILSGGPRWLGAYGVAVAMGSSASALAVAVTVGLFKWIGPRRTRLVAQVLATLVGAGFVIGLQIAAIVSSGTISRTAFLTSGPVISRAPAMSSPMWLPARAMMGDPGSVAVMLAAGLGALMTAILLFAPRFGEHAVAAAGTSPRRRYRPLKTFHPATAIQALRRKEWRLIRRDPWLVSQTLLQVLYLIPPAVMLWFNYVRDDALIVLSPILVMVAGQLAGGLAWLSISGEDAPDLILTAPVRPRAVLRAKIEAVLGGIGLLFVPFLFALAYADRRIAAVAAICSLCAATASILIQLLFRTQAKRSQFRRRQTASRFATFAEAFSSIFWAAAAGLGAADSTLAAFPAGCALLVLLGAYGLRPRTP